MLFLRVLWQILLCSPTFKLRLSNFSSNENFLLLQRKKKKVEHLSQVYPVFRIAKCFKANMKTMSIFLNFFFLLPFYLKIQHLAQKRTNLALQLKCGFNFSGNCLTLSDYIYRVLTFGEHGPHFEIQNEYITL